MDAGALLQAFGLQMLVLGICQEWNWNLLTLWFNSSAAFLLLSTLYPVLIHMENKHDTSRGKMIFSDE